MESLVISLSSKAFNIGHIELEIISSAFRIRQMPHKVFERRGDDLYMNVTISLQVN